MRMNLNPDLHAGSLKAIIHEIVYLSDPEKILLLSSSFEYLITESIYFKNLVRELKCNYYDLLILYGIRERKSLMEREMLLYSHFKDHRYLQFRIYDIDSFNKDLKTGNEQAIHIFKNAMVWYDKEQVPLDCSDTPIC